MVIKNSRAQRRHDRHRLKKTRSHHWGYGYGGWRDWTTYRLNPEDIFMSPKIAGQVVNTPTPCSCHMCRNVRRSGFVKTSEKLTFQERNQVIILKEELDDYYCGL